MSDIFWQTNCPECARRAMRVHTVELENEHQRQVIASLMQKLATLERGKGKGKGKTAGEETRGER